MACAARRRTEKTTGESLSHYLDERGISKERLAALSGISIPTVYRICAGSNVGRIDTWMRIAASLGCKLDDIVGSGSD